MVLVQRILLLPAFSQYMKILQRMNQRTTSLLVSLTTLQDFHLKKNPLPIQQLLEQLLANSGALAVTELLVQTRIPSKSSATTLINTFRHTSSMTLKRQAVSPFLTCVSVINLSNLLIISIRLTSLHVTTLHT